MSNSHGQCLKCIVIYIYVQLEKNQLRYFYMMPAYTQVSDYISYLCQFTCEESSCVDDASVTDCVNEIVNVSENMSDLCTQSTHVLCIMLHYDIHNSLTHNMNQL